MSPFASISSSLSFLIHSFFSCFHFQTYRQHFNLAQVLSEDSFLLFCGEKKTNSIQPQVSCLLVLHFSSKTTFPLHEHSPANWSSSLAETHMFWKVTSHRGLVLSSSFEENLDGLCNSPPPPGTTLCGSLMPVDWNCLLPFCDPSSSEKQKSKGYTWCTNYTAVAHKNALAWGIHVCTRTQQVEEMVTNGRYECI